MGRHPHRLSAGLLLAVWLAAPLLSLMHAVIEKHTYCAQHERVEDAREAHDSLLSGLDQGQLENRSQLHEENGLGGHSAGHEDCAFSDSFTRATILWDVDLHAAPILVTISSGVVVRAVAPVAGIPLLRFAPKSSPPSIV